MQRRAQQPLRPPSPVHGLMVASRPRSRLLLMDEVSNSLVGCFYLAKLDPVSGIRPWLDRGRNPGAREGAGWAASKLSSTSPRRSAMSTGDGPAVVFDKSQASSKPDSSLPIELRLFSRMRFPRVICQILFFPLSGSSMLACDGGELLMRLIKANWEKNGRREIQKEEGSSWRERVLQEVRERGVGERGASVEDGGR